MKHIIFTVPENSTAEQVYDAVGIARRFPLTGMRVVDGRVMGDAFVDGEFHPFDGFEIIAREDLVDGKWEVIDPLDTDEYDKFDIPEEETNHDWTGTPESQLFKGLK